MQLENQLKFLSPYLQDLAFQTKLLKKKEEK